MFCSLEMGPKTWVQDDQQGEKQFQGWSSPELLEQLHGITDL